MGCFVYLLRLYFLYRKDTSFHQQLFQKRPLNGFKHCLEVFINWQNRPRRVWHGARLLLDSLMNNVQEIGSLIGRQVLSVDSANKLGHVHDLIVDPLKGQLAGLSIQQLDENLALVEQPEIHSIGPDAVMVARDESLVLHDESRIKTLPKAKNGLKGVQVITDRGQVIGKIANLFICVVEMPLFIYEVRSSIIDKLLGHALYFPASLGCAFSDDGTALVVPDDTDRMDSNLEAAAQRLLGSYECARYEPGAPRVIVRSHSD